MIEHAIFDLLKSDTGIKSLASSRIYPLVAPQGSAKPYVTYQKVAATRPLHLGGHNGQVRAVFQVDSWAQSSDGARSLADVVRVVLDNYSGEAKNHAIERIFLDGELDNWEFAIDGSEVIYGRVTQTWVVWYAESTN